MAVCQRRVPVEIIFAETIAAGSLNGLDSYPALPADSWAVVVYGREDAYQRRAYRSLRQLAYT